MAQFTITASNITTNSATIELTSEIAHTAASSVDVTVVSSNGVEAYAGTTTIPVGSIGDVISVPVTDLRSNMEYTVTAKTGTTYTDTGTFTTTDDPTARTATQSQWEDLADKVEAASVAQSTLYGTPGNNIDGAMTQNATTFMVFADTSTRNRVRIGTSSSASGQNSVAVGAFAQAYGPWSTALGYSSTVGSGIRGAVAIGPGATSNGEYSIAFTGGETSTQGVFQVGMNNTGWTGVGYNNSNYRLITGVYDGQGLHDAATVAQGNTLATAAPTTSTEGVLGQLYTDTTNMHTYQCTAIDTTDPSNPVYTWVQRW